jgi:MOSC domain-containing protein YiiM
MEIREICVGKPQLVDVDGKAILTSIFKTPVTGRVAVGSTNIEGDEQSDLTVHGGRNKAIYVYSDEYSPDWVSEFGVDALEPSQFGQNLAVTAGTDDAVVIGSQYRIGDVITRVTQPRIPCHKLGVRMGDPDFPNRFWQAGRLGFYLRVDTGGHFEAGDRFELLEQPEHGITVQALYGIVSGDFGRASEAMQQLEHLDSGWQRRLRKAMKSVPSSG